MATGLGSGMGWGEHTHGQLLSNPTILDAGSLGLAKWLAVCVSPAKWRSVTRSGVLERV